MQPPRRVRKPPRRVRGGALEAPRSLLEDTLREAFAKAPRAPRAPPFGNDSSDNDKPPKNAAVERSSTYVKAPRVVVSWPIVYHCCSIPHTVSTALNGKNHADRNSAKQNFTHLDSGRNPKNTKIVAQKGETLVWRINKLVSSVDVYF